MLMFTFVIIEFLMIIFTTLGIWRGKWVLNNLTKTPIIIIKLICTCLVMLLILLLKSYISCFYISTIVSTLSTILMFWLIWQMQFRESLLCSLSSMSILMSLDLFTYTIMLLIEGKHQNPIPYMTLARLIHLLILLIIFRLDVKGLNPLITIRWRDLNKALRTNLYIVFSIIFSSYIINVTLLSMSRKSDFVTLGFEFLILNIITFALIYIAFLVFWVDNDANAENISTNEDITDVVGLNRYLFLLSNVNQIKYNVDAELTKLKNLNYKSIVKFIEYLSPERTIDVSFLFSYNSLVVVLSITNNCDNLVNDDTYINLKKILAKDYNISDNYDADIDAFLIKILQKRREKYETS